MFKKKITYVDYDGLERTEEFMFNLSKVEIAEMELGYTGGIAAKLEKIIADRDGKQIVSTFREIILKSYGVKSDDGRRFIKSQKMSEEFSQTEAYTNLFMELVTNPDAASEFMLKVLPPDMVKAMNEENNTGADDTAVAIAPVT